ncbi:MAG TPA: zf-HC2 domain-containing protein [Blastocatellia bacterium]|nr:zf-HC2 domain-containing protein [Blastocatellia bacterium]
MMSNNRGCDKQEELVSYLYGECAPEAEKRFETHIRECLTCARELREFASLRDTLQSWEVDTLPHIVIEPKRTFGMALRELFAVTPLWAKGFAGVAALLLFAALLNVEVTIGSFKVGAHLFARNGSTSSAAPKTNPDSAQSALNMDEVNKLVDQKVAESQHRNAEEMQTKLTKLEQDIRSSRERELNMIMASIRQDQQQQIRKIVQATIAENNLNFSNLFSDLDSDKVKDKDQDKNQK